MANPTTTIEVNTASAPRTCRVVVGSQILAQSLHGCGASFMVADKHVMRLHGERLGDLAQTPGIELDQGEGTKSFRHLESILDRLAECGADRSSTALAFGGGVTCDIAGLAAALYMRGIPWIAAPTTLLAQVDASVGGKTAINLGAGKNLVGAFHQPDLVIADVALLKTLEKSELVSGLGEVLKTALLGAQIDERASLLEFLERADGRALMACDTELYAAIVTSCVRFKAAVVEADEREAGARKQLNLGHTFGHAIEKVAGFGVVPHGVAVAAGIGEALQVAKREGLLEDLSLPGRAGDLASKLGLPRDLADLRGQCGLELPAKQLLVAMDSDKKSELGVAQLVLPRGVGEWTLGVGVAPFVLP